MKETSSERIITDDYFAIEFLRWDSAILGYKSGLVSFLPSLPQKGSTIERALKECLTQAKFDGYRFLTAKVDADQFELTNSCTHNNGILVDTEVCFSKIPVKQIADDDKPCKKTKQYWDERFYGVAESLHRSRFFRDPEIGSENAVRLWKESIRNHCLGRASYSVIYFNSSAPVGFINVIEQNNVSNIFIIGVLPGFQGQGIGSRMMRFYEMELSESIHEMTVDTQLTNIRAQKLYVNSGYRIKRSQHIIHFWL
jgi:ribosomal protein S18 acetylase RimI-like enzyme